MAGMTRLGGLARMTAATAAALSLFSGFAAAEDGYVDVRVAPDATSCGTVVLMWPKDQPRQDYAPKPIPVCDEPPALLPATAEGPMPVVEPPEVEAIIENEPVTELAEVTLIPVIHHHPAVNAGVLFFPPADAYYRHYSPEEEPSPFTWRADKAEYEEYLRHVFPYYQNAAPGVVQLPHPQVIVLQGQPAPAAPAPAPARPLGAKPKRESVLVGEPAVLAVQADEPGDVWVASPSVRVVTIVAPENVIAVIPPAEEAEQTAVVVEQDAGCSTCK